MTNEAEDTPDPQEQTAANGLQELLSNLEPEEQVAALLQELDNAHSETGQNLEVAQRAQAELVNYRRRADEERISLGKYSNSRLITKLLPVLEDFDLAVAHAGEGNSSAAWLEGVKLIQRKLISMLESEGVATIDAVGAMFNPLEHEAVGTEANTTHPPGFIIQAVRPGYRLHDRVIQPAQVIVAREAENLASTYPSTEEKETEHE